MQLELRNEEGGACGVLAGALDIRHAREAKALLLDAVASHPYLRLDLAGISVLDAAGVQLLMLCKREAVALGHELQLVAHSEAVARQFELLDLAAYFGDPLLLAGNRRGDDA